MTAPRLLFIDIETAPNTSRVWGHYDQNVIRHVEQSYMLCFGYKWEGDRKVTTQALPDFHGYVPFDETMDLELTMAARDLFQEADAVVAHNGDAFDVRKIVGRFIYHDLEPPSMPAQIDTKKIAKRYAKFNSNSLDDLAEHLGLGRKVRHQGFDMWEGCMAGEERWWKSMLHYCKRDVNLLQRLYHRVRPYAKVHPALNRLADDAQACPRCLSRNMQRRGYAYTQVTKFQQWQCQDCGGWTRSRLGETMADGDKKPERLPI